jgi:hypothetical protein
MMMMSLVEIICCRIICKVDRVLWTWKDWSDRWWNTLNILFRNFPSFCPEKSLIYWTVQGFSHFNGTCGSIPVFAKAHHCEPLQSTHHIHTIIPLKYILIISLCYASASYLAFYFNILQPKFCRNILFPPCVLYALPISPFFGLCKAIPLHAMEALEGKGGIAPTHSRPRH